MQPLKRDSSLGYSIDLLQGNVNRLCARQINGNQA